MTKSIRKIALASALALGAATAASAVTVVNGSFEDVSGSTQIAGSGSWSVYETIPGWTTVAGEGIEVQTNTVITAQDGRRYVELDSHPNNTLSGATTNSTMTQVVELALGLYELSFWYSPRTNDPGTNGILYSIGDLAGSITGPGSDPLTSVGSWTRIVETFMITTAGSYNLTFAADGTANRLGGFIDDVSISAIPLPAGGVLLLTALGGLAIVRRRKA